MPDVDASYEATTDALDQREAAEAGGLAVRERLGQDRERAVAGQDQRDRARLADRLDRLGAAAGAGVDRGQVEAFRQEQADQLRACQDGSRQLREAARAVAAQLDGQRELVAADGRHSPQRDVGVRGGREQAAVLDVVNRVLSDLSGVRDELDACLSRQRREALRVMESAADGDLGQVLERQHADRDALLGQLSRLEQDLDRADRDLAPRNQQDQQDRQRQQTADDRQLDQRWGLGGTSRDLAAPREPADVSRQARPEQADQPRARRDGSQQPREWARVVAAQQDQQDEQRHHDRQHQHDHQDRQVPQRQQAAADSQQDLQRASREQQEAARDTAARRPAEAGREQQASRTAAQAESELSFFGRADESGVGVLYIRNWGGLTPQEQMLVRFWLSEADQLYGAGIAGPRQRVTSQDREDGDRVARLGRKGFRLEKHDSFASGHTPDMAGGGNPASPQIELPREVNSSIGGQWRRYESGFRFTGISAYDEATGNWIHLSPALEHQPPPTSPGEPVRDGTSQRKRKPR